MSWSTKMLAGAVGFAVLVFFIAGSSGSTSGSSSSRPAAPHAPVAPPIEVSATALFRAYHQNEVSADDAYKGHRLLVSGRVASIDKDMFDHIIVRLASGSMFQTVDATMEPNQKSEAAALRKGASVNVLCKGNGLIIDPQLADCTLQ